MRVKTMKPSSARSYFSTTSWRGPEAGVLPGGPNVDSSILILHVPITGNESGTCADACSENIPTSNNIGLLVILRLPLQASLSKDSDGSTLPILAEDFTARMARRLGDERGHSDLAAGE
jgi:hypothetical protein